MRVKSEVINVAKANDLKTRQRINISIDRHILAALDGWVDATGENRSRLIDQACKELIEHLENDPAYLIKSRKKAPE
jgi:hypothetical protein